MSLTPDLDKVSLDAMLKTALDAVVVMRLDGTVAGWNHVAEATFGWSFDEVCGRCMSELIIPERYREAHERGLAHYSATGEGPVLDTRLELEALHRAGHEIPVELSITRTNQFSEPVFLGFLRDISERREADRRRALMVQELNHRVKNLFGVVSAFAHQTASQSESLADFLPAFTGRLQSLGRSHEILTASTSERSSLPQLAQALLPPFAAPDNARLSMTGPEVMLTPRQFLSVSMILHELATNAVKYGALLTPAGRVALEWSVDGDTISLAWLETSDRRISAPMSKGFGTRLIEVSVERELKGRSTHDWHPSGLAFHLAFQLD